MLSPSLQPMVGAKKADRYRETSIFVKQRFKEVFIAPLTSVFPGRRENPVPACFGASWHWRSAPTPATSHVHGCPFPRPDVWSKVYERAINRLARTHEFDVLSGGLGPVVLTVESRESPAAKLGAGVGPRLSTLY